MQRSTSSANGGDAIASALGRKRSQAKGRNRPRAVGQPVKKCAFSDMLICYRTRFLANKSTHGESMSFARFTKRLSILFTLSLISNGSAMSASADRQAGAGIEPSLDTAAAVGNLKVNCGSGLVPFILNGNLTAAVDTPLGKISFPGGRVMLGYCGYLVPGLLPSLINAPEKLAKADASSSVTGPNGIGVSCMHGDLPFVLEGAAEGSLRTSFGTLNLQGDRNKIAICLPNPSKN